jgi:uncharacterized DUF497 family protein
MWVVMAEGKVTFLQRSFASAPPGPRPSPPGNPRFLAEACGKSKLRRMKQVGYRRRTFVRTKARALGGVARTPPSFEWDQWMRAAGQRTHGAPAEAQWALARYRRVIAPDAAHSHSEQRYNFFGGVAAGVLAARFGYRRGSFAAPMTAFGAAAGGSMRSKTRCRIERLGKLNIVAHFLPPLNLLRTEGGVKVTLALG